MASITLENVVKDYPGGVQAVRGISFEVKNGEFVALLGPSGCGKSTTMRMIAGLEDVTSGTIYFDGKPVNRVRPRDRNVAMAFETYALYPTLSVYENLAFPLRCAGWQQAKVDEKVREVARLMELSRLLERAPSELSGGQAQRVGLARALIREPAVFLLDEPISHLDTRQRHRMRQFIKRLHVELKYTMIYVTHDQEEAMAMADRIVVMHDGLVRQIAAPDEIYHDPTDSFVASFVGEPPMNFLDGTLGFSDGKWAFQYGDHKFPLTTAMQPKAANLPSNLKMGIRPFYIDLSLEPRGAESMPAEVFVTENLCDYAIVSVELDDARLQVVAPAGFLPRRHDRVYMTVNPNFMRFFDNTTGEAVQL